MIRNLCILCLSICLLACSSPTGEAESLAAFSLFVTEQAADLVIAAEALQAAAPVADADGWNPTDDSAEVDAMKAQWRLAREAYEPIEAAIHEIFSNHARDLDGRYDAFVAGAPDDNLFDGEGVIGVHAIERNLWADSHPSPVVDFESALTNYSAAAFPANEVEATSFATGLLQEFVTETSALHSSVQGLAWDGHGAFEGLLESTEEQEEKINLPTAGGAESRYALHTLADMRANLRGGREMYDAFRDWILDTEGGPDLDALIFAGFIRLDNAYTAIQSDALPTMPATWNPEDPSDADLLTPFGELWSLVNTEASRDVEGSLTHDIHHVGELLGIEVAE